MITTRRCLIVALLAASTTASSCALYMEFDHDNSLQTLASDGGSLNGLAAPDFGLDVADEVFVEPGSSADLPVRVQRSVGAEERRIIVTVAEPYPTEVAAPVLPAVIEVGSTSGVLTIHAKPGVVTTSAKISVVATSGTTTRSKAVSLNIRGKPCTLDTSFGVLGTGTIVVEGERSSILATEDVMFVSGLGAVDRFDSDKGRRWTQVVSKDIVGLAFDGQVAPATTVPSSLYALQIESEGALSSVRLLTEDGAPATTFGEEGRVELAPSCETFAAAGATPSGIAVLCARNTWTLHTQDPNGTVVEGGDVNWLHKTTRIAALVNDGQGRFVACGVLDGVNAAFARWIAADRRVDSTFSDPAFNDPLSQPPGQVFFPPGSLSKGCVADQQGIVSIGLFGGELALIGIRDGVLDSTFGVSGVAQVTSVPVYPLQPFDDVNFDAWIAKQPNGTIITVVNAHGPSYLEERTRDGAFVRSCDLGAITLSNVQSLAVLPSGRAMIVGVVNNQRVLARIWL